MVAKTPLKEKRLAMALDPDRVREAIKKVDKCMTRLEELHYTVTGGRKVISGISLSPRSARGYLKTSLRCKQESLRLRNAAGMKSPLGKFQGSLSGAGEWQKMSIPARILEETVNEILQASKFTKEITSKVPKPNTKPLNVPKTPDSIKRKKPCFEKAELLARRVKEKQSKNRNTNSETTTSSPHIARARSRIAFKSNSPLKRRDNSITVNRVSPRNKPWGKKTVLFPNPIYTSSPPTHCKKFGKSKSPVRKSPPYKFLVKSPCKSLKSQMKSKKAVPAPVVYSPVERKLSASKTRRCSFSPSKLASRLVSPLRSRILTRKSSDVVMSGLKQRPGFSTPVKICSGRRV